ncbi:Uncharacterised protein [Weissella viridescens]|uniref:Uncharacterized protein n=1 Tax=Weissella viridescens TaxID=1629 RepID=A0A380P8B4_WEIVI|nr:Uncharacterised protein [Weissella viridescens]
MGANAADQMLTQADRAEIEEVILQPNPVLINQNPRQCMFKIIGD